MAQTDFPFAAVIFDMDGVIVDTEKFYLGTLAKLFEAEGIEVPFEDLCVTVGASYKDFKRNLVRWFELGGEHLAEEEALARYNAWEERNQPDFAALLNHGVVETIAELKRRGVRVALASSAEEEALARYNAWEERNQPDFAALLNHGVVETIAELKRRGVRVALASSSPISNILLVLGGRSATSPISPRCSTMALWRRSPSLSAAASAWRSPRPRRCPISCWCSRPAACPTRSSW